MRLLELLGLHLCTLQVACLLVISCPHVMAPGSFVYALSLEVYSSAGWARNKANQRKHLLIWLTCWIPTMYGIYTEFLLLVVSHLV